MYLQIPQVFQGIVYFQSFIPLKQDDFLAGYADSIHLRHDGGTSPEDAP